MAADPITEPVNKPREQDPIDLLIAFEEASEVPIRAEYFEGMAVVPPQPDFDHGDVTGDLYHQLRSAGIRLAGMGMGFRTGVKDADETRSLAVPDFYVLRRRPTELDEAYRRAHKGWYSTDLLALVGEVTSSNHETDTGPKYRSYAAAGIPVYVVINREDGHAYVHSEPVSDAEDPRRSHYRTTTTTELGGKLPLPDPYPPLDTSVLPL
ncbi:Uma2 family endonuclease [Streptomyces sp. AV19]|uniref:Uma2 family endonuclease n=1 Tax=Streptomyces sp. AV19 TaxID=2793068 RepID=UPI0018FE8648|nr:Uma2 family endonuclease [Streptomyces sp. AV19]MBH1935229.1 Uma2 family endonuclease [Streptomyces sp. AV19]MDG4531130.1 Uma2 family endonuclease [Streptomyces sp. AV19]